MADHEERKDLDDLFEDLLAISRLCINCIYCSTDLSGAGYCSLTGEDKELWSVYQTCGFYEFSDTSKQIIRADKK